MYYYNLGKLIKDFANAGEDINDWYVTEDTYEYDGFDLPYDGTFFVKGRVIGVDNDGNNIYEHEAILDNKGLSFYKGVTEVIQVCENQPPLRRTYYEKVES